MIRTRFIFFILGLLLFQTASPLCQNKIIMPEGMDMGLPFSPGIQAGEVLFLSGAIGNQPGTTEVKGDIEVQTKQVFTNFEKVLETAGLSLKDIVSSTVYLADSRHYAQMNQVYSQYFPNNPPVRTTVEGDMVIKNSLVEISAIAVHPDLPRRVITPESWPKPQRPYSWAILIEDTLFISGMVGQDVPANRLVTDSFEQQAEQAFRNIGTILESADMGFENVVSSRVYLSDSRDFQSMNQLYRKYFKKPPPVRATVQARLANPGMKIEIQCVAVRDIPIHTIGSSSSSPFSAGIITGNWLLTAGMVGRGSEGFAKGDARAQTRQTLENLKRTLAEGEMDFSDVVDVQVYLSDVRYYADMNEVYREIMPKAPPARATVGTPLMSPEALVEIMMTARKK
jgi:2-iminobutanoate/2-iminopropanoate deaminase